MKKHTYTWKEGFDADAPCYSAYWVEHSVLYTNRTLPQQVELTICNDDWEFWIIVGRYINGYYMSFPYKSAGCDLAGDLGDPQWNIRRLLKALPDDEWIAWMICYALLDYRAEKLGY